VGSLYCEGSESESNISLDITHSLMGQGAILLGGFGEPKIRAISYEESLKGFGENKKTMIL